MKKFEKVAKFGEMRIKDIRVLPYSSVMEFPTNLEQFEGEFDSNYKKISAQADKIQIEGESDLEVVWNCSENTKSCT